MAISNDTERQAVAERVTQLYKALEALELQRAGIRRAISNMEDDLDAYDIHAAHKRAKRRFPRRLEEHREAGPVRFEAASGRDRQSKVIDVIPGSIGESG